MFCCVADVGCVVLTSSFVFLLVWSSEWIDQKAKQKLVCGLSVYRYWPNSGYIKTAGFEKNQQTSCLHYRVVFGCHGKARVLSFFVADKQQREYPICTATSMLAHYSSFPCRPQRRRGGGKYLDNKNNKTMSYYLLLTRNEFVFCSFSYPSLTLIFFVDQCQWIICVINKRPFIYQVSLNVVC